MKWLDSAWWFGMEKLLGVQCPRDPEGTYHVLKLGKDQSKIRVIEALELDGIKALHNILERNKKLPIVLVPEDPMIMERLLPPDPHLEPVSAVMGVGVGDNDEFEVIQISGFQNQIWTSLMRKDAIQRCSERLGVHQNRLLTAVFSPSVAAYLLPQALPDFELNNTVLTLLGKTYFFEQGLLCSEIDFPKGIALEANEKDLAVVTGTTTVFAMLYASLFFVWIQSAGNATRMPYLSSWQSYRATSKLRQIASVSALVMFLWFALIFSLRIQGERRKAALEFEYSQNLPVLTAIQQLDEKIAARQALGNQLGGYTLRPSKASYYLDRIAANVPGDMHISEIVFGPTEEDFKRQGLREVSAKELIIRGECGSSGPIAQFSDLLQGLSGINNVVVEQSELNFQTDLYEFVFLANTEALHPSVGYDSKTPHGLDQPQSPNSTQQP